MSIGATIKKLRRDKNITQEQLAEMLGISTNAVSQWECDKTAPDISHLPILANIFEVSADVLLEIDIALHKKDHVGCFVEACCKLQRISAGKLSQEFRFSQNISS